MTVTSAIPDAPAKFDRGEECFLWIVTEDPLCGDRHVHGGGPLDRDPRELLGHRVAHCCKDVDTIGGYTLVEDR